MQDYTESACIRCGKIRIFKRKWKEKVKGPTITHIEMVCPDPECQKIVDADFAARREKRLNLENKRQGQGWGDIFYNCLCFKFNHSQKDSKINLKNFPQSFFEFNVSFRNIMDREPGLHLGC